ncbi:MAG: methyltransferase domain-containing protein [Devosia sp.]
MPKLEIGAGLKPQAGYVHHDVRPLEGIDVVCDARDFPEEHHGVYDEVYASNVIEHFNRFEVCDVLKHWATLLKSGGILHLITPDNEEICRQYLARQITHDQFVYLTYGGNDYEYNRHYYGFCVEHMVEIFQKCGLATVSCVPGKSWFQKQSFFCPMIVARGIRL